MSNKELSRRVKLTNPELIGKLYDSGKDLAVVFSHFNNWEWLTTVFQLYTDYKCVGVYKPVKNKIVNKFLNRLSDYLFVLSRKAGLELDNEEIKWSV